MRLEREVQNLHILNEIDYGPDENQQEADIIARIGSRAIDEWNRKGVVPEGWQADPAKIRQSWFDLANMAETHAPDKTALAVTNVGVGIFSLALTGDFERAARNHGLKLSMGGLSIFTKEKNEQYWKVKEWNIRPKGSVSGAPLSRRF
jgi:probable phosphoglycerate mutase